ncbi:Ig-like domain-containing protein [Anaerocolumna xylanovorans]|uniref:Ig-like domain (Group 2) n=1 Tax=Anaerocolumna xylanovorans DSM 12503 TaxID=1121345 RepID=A0A1M7YHH5_9FIRM|nr:Ig-like domain-containing protein [Anaerocolumna xylanovorans]SHO52080.1 Ig-like domain (group 2) [Anaerocolumna xylanovorans DSM 12503]
MKISKRIMAVCIAAAMMMTMFTTNVKAANMADLATSISNFEVLNDVTIKENGTNYYSVDITGKGTLTLTTTRNSGDYLSINVYNENGEGIYSNSNPNDYVGKDVQQISLEKGTYIISIYSSYGRSYNLTTSFKKTTASEIIMTAKLKKGKTLQLGAELTEGTSKITWKSGKTSVAKVSYNGLVAGVKAGSAIITATSQSGLTTKIKVIVTE